MLTFKSLDNEEKTTILFYVQVNRVSKKVDLWTRLFQAIKKVRYPFFQSLLLLEDWTPVILNLVRRSLWVMLWAGESKHCVQYRSRQLVLF